MGGTHQVRHREVGQVDERSSQGEANGHREEGEGAEASGGRGHLNRRGQERPIGSC